MDSLYLSVFAIGSFLLVKLGIYQHLDLLVGCSLRALPEPQPYPSSTPVSANETAFQGSHCQFTTQSFPCVLVFPKLLTQQGVSKEMEVKYFSLVLTCMRRRCITRWLLGAPRPSYLLSTVVLGHRHTHFYVWSVAAVPLPKEPSTQQRLYDSQSLTYLPSDVIAMFATPDPCHPQRPPAAGVLIPTLGTCSLRHAVLAPFAFLPCFSIPL